MSLHKKFVESGSMEYDTKKIMRDRECCSDNRSEADSKGRTLLHWAAKFRHLKVVEYWVSHGADTNSTMPVQESPLHLAAGDFDKRRKKIFRTLYTAYANSREKYS